MPPVRPPDRLRPAAPRPAVVAPLALALLAAFAWPGPARAISQQVPVGPKAMGMGGAFSSIADDATALFWNPAGMAWIGHQEFGGSYANLFQSDIKDNHLAFVLPLAPRQAAGLDWYHSGFDDGELGFSENRIDLSYAARWRSLLSVGGGVKYLNRSTSLDGSTVRRGSGAGVDLGVILNPITPLRLGLVAQDLTNTRLNYTDGGGSANVYPRNVRFGASYALRRLGTVAMDVDDSWHVGVEARPQDLFALRAGVQEQRTGGDGPTWSVGAGVKWSIAHADFAYVVPPSLAATSYFGLSFSFNFNPSLVKIEKVNPDPVYASLYKRYDDHPFGTIELRNQTERDVDADVSVFIAGTMDRPTSRQVDLVPGKVTTVPLEAVMSERAMRLTNSGLTPLQVEVHYTSVRLPRTEKRTDKVRVYAPGAMSWAESVAPAAAFITVDDVVVQNLARGVVSGSPVPAQGILHHENLARAAALFDAVGTLGVRYVMDPTSPFASPGTKQGGFDTIYYPRETLARKAGDCDDLTVLMASLLGNVGIATQLVDVPGHILLLFDSGIPAVQRTGLGVPEDMTVVLPQKNNVWIPLECTALDDGFAHAWDTGARVVARHRADEGAANMFVDVARAQVDYEPAVPTAPAPTLEIDRPRLEARYATDRDTLDTWLADFERDLERRASADSVAAAVRVATSLAEAQAQFRSGNFGRTREILDQLARQAPASAAVQNNRGDVAFASDSLDAARELYRRARELDPDDPGTILNLGLVEYAAGDTAASFDVFAQGITAAGSDTAAARVLGLAGAGEEVSVLKESPPRITPGELRALLQQAARRVPRPPSAARTRPGGPTVSKVAASRATRPEEFAPYLYWKP